MSDWKFPADVRGWLTEAEGRKLAELARDKRVLEIGSFCGRSTICLAQTAKDVFAVDPFDSRATGERGDTLQEFVANTRRYGVGGRVGYYQGTLARWLQEQPKGDAFDLIFVDGAHDYAGVRADIAAARGLLAPGGLLAFHDYRTQPGGHDGRWDPGVTRAVNDLLALDGALVERAGSLAVVRLLQPGEPNPVQDRASAEVLEERPHVFLGMPSANRQVHLYAALSYAKTAARRCRVFHAEAKSSLFPDPFNALWADALNRRAELSLHYFAMLHTDVAPAEWWVDTLIGELERTGADLVSAVAPIKDSRGLSSTAVDDRADPWAPVRRLTMHEVHRLPETFGNEDVGGQLLANTGCWACRLDRPWCDATDEDGALKVFFEVRTRVLRLPDGTFKSQAIPEDWLFSRKVAAEGGVVLATRKVRLQHYGELPYPNDRPWGECQTDRPRSATPSRNGAASLGTTDAVCVGAA